MDIVIAAFCYTGKKEKFRILLITSSTGRWIIPKGQPEKQKKRRIVALEEAWEEGGVIGKISGTGRDIIVKRGSRQLWRFYPVKIKDLADTWPEDSYRERRLVTPDEAAELIDSRGLVRAVLEMSDKIQRDS